MIDSISLPVPGFNISKTVEQNRSVRFCGIDIELKAHKLYSNVWSSSHGLTDSDGGPPQSSSLLHVSVVLKPTARVRSGLLQSGEQLMNNEEVTHGH